MLLFTFRESFLVGNKQLNPLGLFFDDSFKKRFQFPTQEGL